MVPRWIGHRFVACCIQAGDPRSRSPEFGQSSSFLAGRLFENSKGSCLQSRLSDSGRFRMNPFRAAGCGFPEQTRHSSEAGYGAFMDGPLLLYDGDCGLCHRVVRFVLRYERASIIQFAALQSPMGCAWATRTGTALGTMLFIEDGTALARSDAALAIARYLRAPWRWGTALRVVPRPIRDAAYNTVARHRLRWFGAAHCQLPAPEQRARFLE